MTRGQGAKKHLGVEQIAVHGLSDDLRHLPVLKFDEGEMLGAACLQRNAATRHHAWSAGRKVPTCQGESLTLRFRASLSRVTVPNCEKNPFICSS